MAGSLYYQRHASGVFGPFLSDINSESQDLSGQLMAIAVTFDLSVAVVMN